MGVICAFIGAAIAIDAGAGKALLAGFNGQACIGPSLVAALQYLNGCAGGLGKLLHRVFGQQAAAAGQHIAIGLGNAAQCLLEVGSQRKPGTGDMAAYMVGASGQVHHSNAVFRCFGNCISQCLGLDPGHGRRGRWQILRHRAAV